MRFCPIPKWDICIVFRCKLPHFKIRFFPNGLELQNPMPKNWQFMYFYWVFCSQNVWPLMKSYEKSASSAPSAGQLENHVFDLCWPLYVPFCRMRHIMLVVLNNKIQFQSQNWEGYREVRNVVMTLSWAAAAWHSADTDWLSQTTES